MRNRSIRFKLTVWFSLVLSAVAAVTFGIVCTVSGMVLQGTVRDYLISAVEENAEKIQYVDAKGDTLANSYIPYGEGYLQIDLDFMDVINDVHSALFTSGGVMLYGENLLSRQLDRVEFTDSHTWRLQTRDLAYTLYDRKLTIDLPDGEVLWIRGVAPETKSADQMQKITHISLVLLPTLIVLSVISGYLLADKLLSPIRRIERTAEEITRGDDLKKRIETGKNRDEVARLAQVFNRMLDRLEQAFESERRFTSDASHELRTPTAVILAQSEYILEKERTGEEYVEALEVVHKQGQRMNMLITDMLDYTRMEQSSERYPLEMLDLSQLVNETGEQMRLLGTNGISLTLQVSDGVTVRGNRLLLSRLLQNLISNAYRYGRENGHVLVSLALCDGAAVLSVEDDGIGIPPEEKDRIFDRFYRSDLSRSVQGTGLGLSMVKRIAELHGARIEVESTVGVGSRFRILFSKT